MGSSESKPPVLKSLVPLSHPAYGPNISANQSRNKVYQTLDLDEVSLQSLKSLAKNRQLLKHPHLLTVNNMWMQQYRQHCSLYKKYKVTLEYPFVERTLQDEIGKYCDLQRPVPEPLVRTYFSQIVSCLEYLQAQKTCHGDVKPTTILIKDNQAFLADSYFIHGGKVSYEIVMQDPESLSLLSPSQLESLRKKRFISLQQIHEDEIFAVGLSMMEAMTAEPAMQCYDLMNLHVKPEYFKKKYSQMLSCGYSPQLCQLVMSCVDARQVKRPKFSQFLVAINNKPPNINQHPQVNHMPVPQTHPVHPPVHPQSSQINFQQRVSQVPPKNLVVRPIHRI